MCFSAELQISDSSFPLVLAPKAMYVLGLEGAKRLIPVKVVTLHNIVIVWGKKKKKEKKDCTKTLRGQCSAFLFYTGL